VTSSAGRFLVHYATSGPHGISAAKAQDLGRYADDAYRVEIGQWGWPAPIDDGDGLVDIYVYRQNAAGVTVADAIQGQASAWIGIHPEYINPITPAHELLHVSQAAITAEWQGVVLVEGLAIWASWAVTENRAPPDWAQFSDTRPFGCTGYVSCVDGKWALFQFLAERYGHDVLIDAYAHAGLLGGDPEQRAVPAIDAALRAQGSSLTSAFSRYVEAATTGDFELGVLREFTPAPAKKARLRCRGKRTDRLEIDHLSSRWVEYLSTCFGSAVNVRLVVSWPAGLQGVRPAVGFHGDVHGLRRRVRAGRMTTSIPLAAVGGDLARVGLPNPSLTADAQTFRVTAWAQSRPLARVRVLGKPRVSRSRILTAPIRSARRVWLGVGLSASRNPVRETVVLARARRGASKLRVRVPSSLPRGRYLVSIRGGLMEGKYSAQVRLPGR
jgi:hypothetical protein